MLGGHMRKSAGASGDFAIAFVNGPITFRSEEGVLYARLFHIVRVSLVQSAALYVSSLVSLGAQVDTDSDGYIGGAEGAAFIRRARLLNDANREVGACAQSHLRWLGLE